MNGGLLRINEGVPTLAHGNSLPVMQSMEEPLLFEFSFDFPFTQRFVVPLRWDVGLEGG